MTRSQFTTLIEAIGDGDKNTAAEVRAVLNALKDGIALSGDIKFIKATPAYLAVNFDATGLGRNDREGWARCNGLNGTDPVEDKFILASGTVYDTPGAIGGSETLMLTAQNIPELTINYTGSNDDTGDIGDYLITSPTDSNGAHQLKTVAGTTPIDKMPPYIALICIQKI